jgi:hypothetical protein
MKSNQSMLKDTVDGGLICGHLVEDLGAFVALTRP